MNLFIHILHGELSDLVLGLVKLVGEGTGMSCCLLALLPGKVCARHYQIPQLCHITGCDSGDAVNSIMYMGDMNLNILCLMNPGIENLQFGVTIHSYKCINNTIITGHM